VGLPRTGPFLSWNSLRNLFARPVVALSLEGATLRVIGCRGREVEFWLSVPFDSGFLESGFVADPLGMGQIIGSAFRSRNLPTRHVICALPAYGCSFRSFGIPRISGYTDSVAPREARRLMGISLDTMHLSWQTVGVRRGQEHVFAVAVPRAPLETMAEALGLAGIPPRVMDLKPLALTRMVGQANAVVVNVERTSVDVVVVRESVPFMVRSLCLMESALDEVLSRAVEEAGTLMEQAQAETALPGSAHLHLTGDMAASEGLAYRLETRTGRRTVPLVSPLRAPSDFPLARFAVNVGLALHEALG
jgi:Tfp pilus assembly PilM family ATPase